jgi:hypothetical protein
MALTGFSFRLSRDSVEGHFDNAHQSPKLRVLKSFADTTAHRPSRFIRPEGHIPANPTDAGFSIIDRQKADELEPATQLYIGILKDRTNEM